MSGKKWVVKIIEIETDDVIEEFPTESERTADRIHDGISINLDHENFYLEIEEVS